MLACISQGQKSGPAQRKEALWPGLSLSNLLHGIPVNFHLLSIAIYRTLMFEHYQYVDERAAPRLNRSPGSYVLWSYVRIYKVTPICNK